MNDDLELEKYVGLKPSTLIISELKWKYLVRAVLKQKNVMIIGHTGTAKTLAARCVANVLKRNIYITNFGSTQDARATLIGNTTYKKEFGTLFHKSAFVNAITTPNMIVVLDEFTRGTHDAHNIILPTLDPIQRCLRLDEDENSTLINVADGVCFIATCNIGSKYTATKILDIALSRRFPVKLEMSLLTGIELQHLFDILFPNKTLEQKKLMKTLADISDDLVAQCQLEDAKISSIISPANLVEMAELVLDGFSLEEIADGSIYPEYTNEGGAESERAMVKMILQKHIPKNVKSPINDPLKRKK